MTINMGLNRVTMAIVATCMGIMFSLFVAAQQGPYNWMRRDNFDLIMEKMDLVNEFNCKELGRESLRLPPNSVGQKPKFNILPQIVIFPNRTNLIHMHNMALNRAYFYSYILQRLNESQNDFPMLPGMLYYYMSASADVSSSIGLMNGSGVLFDTHTQYANWYKSILMFNNTLNLFGPKAFLVDDYQDPVNWLREPTNNTIKVEDLGAGPDHNYTASWHPLNYMVVRDRDSGIDFIPDDRTDYRAKHQYDYAIYNATRVGEMERMPNIKRQFFGPPSPGISETYQPVYFTRPYYDCGRSNKWIVSSVAPVIDFMHRYSIETKLRRPQYVAITVTDVDFLRIDFDPCQRSEDSPDYTYFSGVARCQSTTLCEPVPGYGFKRGGYMCHCRPGYRYPYWQNGPFLGRDIEQASEIEMYRFQCIPIDWKLARLTERGITPSSGGGGGSGLRRRKRRSTAEVRELVDLMRVYNATGLADLRAKAAEHDRLDKEAARSANSLVSRVVKRVARSISTRADLGDQNVHYLGRLGTFEPERHRAVLQLMARKAAVTPENCASKQPHELELPGEVGHGAEVNFQVQARSALRLAHFLSAFSQTVDPFEVYGAFHSDNLLNREQLFGEAFANIMSDGWVRSAGIYFDREAFWDPQLSRRIEYFGPTAYKTAGQNDNGDQKLRRLSFIAEDAAGWPLSRAYYEREWFRTLKQRWASNTYGLEVFVNNPFVRADLNGSQSKPFQRYPLYYRAPRFEDMHWSKPHFDCNLDRNPNARHISDWVITVAAPFFGFSEQKTLKFMGATTVTVQLDRMDINQCPANFYEANYFKNTAPCHMDTSFCVPVIRNQFQLDNYKCECRQGFEYPYDDISIWFFAGGTVSDHYVKSQRNQSNYYRMLTCREAGGSIPTVNFAALALSAFTVMLGSLQHLQM